jgi:hypothetical protein
MGKVAQGERATPGGRSGAQYLEAPQNMYFAASSLITKLAALYELCAAPSPWPEAIFLQPLRRRRYPSATFCILTCFICQFDVGKFLLSSIFENVPRIVI